MADLTVLKYDRKGDPDYGMQDWGAFPPEALQSGEPVQTAHTYLDTASSIFYSGVWLHATRAGAWTLRRR
jgi:hypothetical protein